MKKSFIKLLTISALAFSAIGCSTKTSASENTGETSTPTSQAPTGPVFTITPKKTAYQVEVGQTFSVSFTVTCTDITQIKTLSFTLNNENENKPSVTSSSKHTSVELKDGASASLYAKKVGKCELVAASTVDPSQSVTVEIEVVAALPTLADTWANINKLDNYTLDITRKATNSEVTSHTDWDEDTRIPVQETKITKDALIVTKATDVKEDLTYTASPLYTTSDGEEVLGLGIDSEGFGSVLRKKGNTYSVGNRFTTSQCFLVEGLIAGLGDSSASPNDTYVAALGEDASSIVSLGGLQFVNSTWFSSIEKDYSNFYDANSVIDGEREENSDLAMAAIALWQLVDVQGFETAVASASSTTFIDLAKKVDTSIKVVDAYSVEIEIETPDNDFFVTMKDTNTTTVDSAITTYLSTATTTVPDLKNSALQQIYSYIHANDYWEDSTSQLDDEGTTFNHQTYNFGNYYFQDATDDEIAKYNKSVEGTNYSKFTRGGYVFVNDEMHSFTYTPAVTTGEGEEAVTTPASVQIDSKPIELTKNNQKFTKIEKEDFYSALLTFAACPAFDLETGILHTFTADTQNGIIYSQSSLASDYISYYYFGGSYTIESLVKRWGYTLDSKMTYFYDMTSGKDSENKSIITSTKVFMGTFNTNYGYPFELKFQTESNNKAHETIEAAIAAFGK